MQREEPGRSWKWGRGRESPPTHPMVQPQAYHPLTRFPLLYNGGGGLSGLLVLCMLPALSCPHALAQAVPGLLESLPPLLIYPPEDWRTSPQMPALLAGNLHGVWAKTYISSHSPHSSPTRSKYHLPRETSLPSANPQHTGPWIWPQPQSVSPWPLVPPEMMSFDCLAVVCPPTPIETVGPVRVGRW